MIRVLITGAKGQLGQSIRAIENEVSNMAFYYTDKDSLDLTEMSQIQDFFEKNSIDWCVNCAAYTAVDGAENDSDNARKINVDAVRNLVGVANTFDVKLIHISTDFVFNGQQGKPYKETDKTEPLGVYGETKLEGELAVRNSSEKYFIIRTSWLYSEYQKNFLKTMLHLAESRDEIGVVADQIGSPTYAKDLARAIASIIDQDSTKFGLYHYCNTGVASWFDFAKTIFEINGNSVITNPITTADYPTPAKRPHFSVLDTSKIKKTFKLAIPYWKDSLKVAISNL